MTAVLVLALTLLTSAAQERYARATVTEQQELKITTTDGRDIVLAKERDKVLETEQVGFQKVAISPDGSAVGWIAYHPNGGTSYPIPRLVEIYARGNRRVLDELIPVSDWCFIDGGEQVAILAQLLHGPSHASYGLWEVSTGRRMASFTWLERERPPSIPAWVEAITSHRNSTFKSKSTPSQHCRPSA